jgi:membrane associated rhomboid family serine protease
MAIGITPKYIQDFPLHELSDEQFLVLALEAASQLAWKVTYISASGLIAYTNKGLSSKKAKIEIRIINGIANLKSSSIGTELFDNGRNKKTVDAFLSAFYEVKATATAGDIITKYRELTESNKIDENDVLNVPPPPMERITGVIGILKPTNGYFITPLIIDANVLLFILMVASGVSILSPDTDSLLRWGADFRPLTLSGEWWRLVTNIFLHIGIMHLVMNMFALIYIGLMLEPYLGKARFLAAYFLTGIAASLTSMCWYSLTVSAGASGAIFGMYGVFLALLTSNFIEEKTRKDLLMSIAVFVAYNLLGGMRAGVDNSAHLGGLISGAIIGYAFIPSLKKPGEKGIEFATIFLLSALTLVSAIVVFKTLSNDIGKYDMEMKPFFINENLATEVLKLPDTTAKKELVYGLRDRGIYYWKENLALLDKVDKLNLPDVLRQRDEMLRQYCMLRIKSYELMCKDLEEGTDTYKTQIEDDNKQISALIDSLKK